MGAKIVFTRLVCLGWPQKALPIKRSCHVCTSRSSAIHGPANFRPKDANLSSKEGTLATGHVVKFQQAVDLLPRPRARSNGRVIVGAIALRGEGGEFSSTFSSNWFDGITMVRHGMPACPITVPVNFFRHFSLFLRSCVSCLNTSHSVICTGRQLTL